MSGEDLDQLGRQVERGSLFTHTALGRGFVRLRELESFVYGLIDALIARNVVTQEEIADAVASVSRQLDASGEIPEPGVALRVAEPDSTAPPVVVDCEARMHVCHAVCCKLDVVLSAGEVEEGKAKWDLGRPYLLRRESDGLCTHNDREHRLVRDLRRPPGPVPAVHVRRRREDLEGLREDGAQPRMARGEPLGVTASSTTCDGRDASGRAERLTAARASQTLAVATQRTLRDGLQACYGKSPGNGAFSMATDSPATRQTRPRAG